MESPITGGFFLAPLPSATRHKKDHPSGLAIKPGREVAHAIPNLWSRPRMRWSDKPFSEVGRDVPSPPNSSRIRQGFEAAGKTLEFHSRGRALHGNVLPEIVVNYNYLQEIFHRCPFCSKSDEWGSYEVLSHHTFTLGLQASSYTLAGSARDLVFWAFH